MVDDKERMATTNSELLDAWLAVGVRVLGEAADSSARNEPALLKSITGQGLPRSAT